MHLLLNAEARSWKLTCTDNPSYYVQLKYHSLTERKASSRSYTWLWTWDLWAEKTAAAASSWNRRRQLTRIRTRYRRGWTSHRLTLRDQRMVTEGSSYLFAAFPLFDWSAIRIARFLYCSYALEAIVCVGVDNNTVKVVSLLTRALYSAAQHGACWWCNTSSAA